MRFTHTLVPAVALIALSLTAMPADAQQRRSSGNRGGGGQTAPRASELRQRAAPRSGGQQQQSYTQRAVPRPGPAPRVDNNRGYNSNRGYDSGRAYGNRAPVYSNNNAYGYRGDAGRRYVAPRGGYGAGYASRYGYGYGYRPYYYPRPYYSFRPRLSLGFGLWIGFPAAYPYYSYGYSRRAYGYPLSRFGLSAGTAYGGISFEVDPYDAAVFIDGEYAGVVGDFGPNAQPLTLRAGNYRVEIQANGYEPVMFDVNVMPGQVIPYRGSLRYY